MEEKYINKILNFADENICSAKELVINKEQAKKIVKELEELGHKNVEVWYETIRGGAEMSGYEGGWAFCSGDEEESYFDPCLGYNFEEALENIEQYDLREE